jgi:hypothetical protein
MDKSALIGMHHESLLDSMKLWLKFYEFNTYTAPTKDEMLRLLGERKYDLCLMNANLGTPRGLDISPCREVYSALRSRPGYQETFFLAFSGFQETVENALREGIPTVFTAEVFGKLKDRLASR